MSDQKNIVNYIYFSLAIFFGLGFIKIISLIPFARMAGDDFSYGYTLNSLGVIAAQEFWYVGWTGRYSATFLQTATGSFFGENGSIAAFTSVTILALIASFSYLYKNLFFEDKKDKTYLLLGAVSAILLYAILPDKDESFYYMSGSITYLWPSIFAATVAALLVSKKENKFAMILLAVLTFIMAGFNESFAFLAAIVFAALLVRSLFRSYLQNALSIKSVDKKLLIAFSFSLLGLSLMFFSPGNSVRSSGPAADNMSIGGTIAYSIQDGPQVLFRVLSEHSILLFGFLIVSSYILSNALEGKKAEIGKYMTGAVFILSAPLVLGVLYLVPAYKVLGRLPPERSYATLSFIIVLSLVLSSKYFAKIISVQKLAGNAGFNFLVLMAGFIVLVSSFGLVKELGSDLYIARDYAIAYDEMHARLVAAGNAELDEPLVLPALPESGLIHSAQLEGDENHWYSQAIANYFGIKSGVSAGKID